MSFGDDTLDPDNNPPTVHCLRCGRAPIEYPFCSRESNDCAAKRTDAIHMIARDAAIAKDVVAARATTETHPDGTPLVEHCYICDQFRPLGHGCLRPGGSCSDERPATRVITITEPGYEVAFFTNKDGGGEAVISRPGERPTVVNIAAPEPGRRIAIERKGATFQIMYRDAKS
jgi:hypothetical protein